MTTSKKTEVVKKHKVAAIPEVVVLADTPGVVRVRMLKPAVTKLGALPAGASVEVDAAVANSWLKAGIAEQDKSLDGPKETK
jgi:hypothetical protein